MAQRAENPLSIARTYVSKDIKTADEALEGARHIIAEWINERTDIRNLLRRQLERHALLVTTVIASQKTRSMPRNIAIILIGAKISPVALPIAFWP